MRSAFCFVVALALAGGGCSHPEPFDPGTGCPQIAYCGQCASRGGCAWCGNPNDSAGGQCVAVGKSECSAPAAWSKTPDHCPSPPADAGLSTDATAQTPQTDDHDSPEKKAVGPQKYAAVKKALKEAFPSANVTDHLVDAVVQVLILRERLPGQPAVAGGSQREKAPIEKTVHEKDHRLYLGQATHHRVKGLPPASRPMQSEFTMALPMVRVALPEKLDPDHTRIETEIGDVDLSRDHLLGSVDLVTAKYGGADYLGYRPARMELITPTRAANTRFGAIAVYIGFRDKADRGPSFYLLEAGTATGDAKMIYFSPNMQPIKSVTSYYLPTPFVTMRNTYSGGLTMKPAPNEDEPDVLVVNSYAVGEKDPYITVTVKYERTPTMELPLPFELIVDAGARVSLIANALGLSHAEDLQPLLSKLGTSLSWQEVPHYTAPTATPSATATPAAPPSH